MLKKLDAWIAGHMAIVSPASLVCGIILAPWISGWRWIVPWVFAVMTFQSSLGSGFKEVGHAFRHPLPLVASLLALHVLLSAIAMFAGKLCFGTDHELVTGMVLEFSIPTGIVTLIWVSISQGNSALTLSLVFLDTILAPLVVPSALAWLVGADIKLDATVVLRMMKGLAFMVAIPAALAVCLNQATKGKVKTSLMPRLSPFCKLGFVVVITLNSTGLHKYVVENPSWKLAGIAAAMCALAIVGFAAGYLLCKLLRTDSATSASLVYGVGMRNISAGATIASAYFPGQAVILPVMTATLFQQVLAATAGAFFIKKARGQ